MRSFPHRHPGPVYAAVLAVAGLFLLASCSPDFGSSFEKQPDGSYSIPEKRFGRLAVALSGMPAEEADSLIGVLYDFADSVSCSSGDASTFRSLSEMFAGTFFTPGEPLYDEDVYAAVLRKEMQCRTVTSEEKLGIGWYLNMISCNRPGSEITDMLLTSADGKEIFLHDELDGPALVFLYGSRCSLCRQLAVDLSSSESISSACRNGRVSLISIFVGDDDDVFGSMCRQLGQMWKNFRDAEHAVQMRNIFDLRLIPSVYAVDGDRTVLVKGAVDVSSIEDILPQLCR